MSLYISTYVGDVVKYQINSNALSVSYGFRIWNLNFLPFSVLLSLKTHRFSHSHTYLLIILQSFSNVITLWKFASYLDTIKDFKTGSFHELFRIECCISENPNSICKYQKVLLTAWFEQGKILIITPIILKWWSNFATVRTSKISY